MHVIILISVYYQKSPPQLPKPRPYPPKPPNSNRRINHELLPPKPHPKLFPYPTLEHELQQLFDCGVQQ